MPQSANAEVFDRAPQAANQILTSEELLSEAERGASQNIWHARLGVPGVYRLDVKNETFFFEVWCRHILGENRNLIRIFPVSYWKDGERIDHVPPRQKGERQAFLPSCVLYGKFDPERVPEEYREDLNSWADICLDGISAFDKLSRQRRRRTH